MSLVVQATLVDGKGNPLLMVRDHADPNYTVYVSWEDWLGVQGAPLELQREELSALDQGVGAFDAAQDALDRRSSQGEGKVEPA